jgi:hypothetical protein
VISRIMTVVKLDMVGEEFATKTGMPEVSVKQSLAQRHQRVGNQRCTTVEKNVSGCGSPKNIGHRFAAACMPIAPVEPLWAVGGRV